MQTIELGFFYGLGFAGAIACVLLAMSLIGYSIKAIQFLDDRRKIKKEMGKEIADLEKDKKVLLWSARWEWARMYPDEPIPDLLKACHEQYRHHYHREPGLEVDTELSKAVRNAFRRQVVEDNTDAVEADIDWENSVAN